MADPGQLDLKVCSETGRGQKQKPALLLPPLSTGPSPRLQIHTREVAAADPLRLEKLSAPGRDPPAHLQGCQGLGEGGGGQALACVHQDDQPQLPHLLPGERKTGRVKSRPERVSLSLHETRPHPDALGSTSSGLLA